MTGFLARITHRSGRRSKEYNVILPKPAEEYVTGEQFEIEIDGRTRPVHVEIPISEDFKQLYVA